MFASAAPTISVVMSVYNSARYLAEAIQSILSQTNRDFEFIIINDGSTDDALAICQRFEQQDRRIRIVDQPNAGLTRSLNVGLRLARGEFVARMDADDVAEFDRFERQLRFLRDHPKCVAVGSRLLLIDPDGDPLAEQQPPASHEEIVAGLLTGYGAIPHPSAMIRRESLTRVGGYREKFTCAQDLDLWLRLSEIGQLANVDETLLRYRLHDQSITTQRRELQLECAKRAVSDAYNRQGQSLPASFSLPDPAQESRERTLRWWARMALRSGHVDVARKHAWAAFMASPFSWQNVHLATRFLTTRRRKAG